MKHLLCARDQAILWVFPGEDIKGYTQHVAGLRAPHGRQSLPSLLSLGGWHVLGYQRMSRQGLRTRPSASGECHVDKAEPAERGPGRSPLARQAPSQSGEPEGRGSFPRVSRFPTVGIYASYYQLI